jgi:hypothetical protein
LPKSIRITDALCLPYHDFYSYSDHHNYCNCCSLDFYVSFHCVLGYLFYPNVLVVNAIWRSMILNGFCGVSASVT